MAHDAHMRKKSDYVKKSKCVSRMKHQGIECHLEATFPIQQGSKKMEGTLQ